MENYGSLDALLCHPELCFTVCSAGKLWDVRGANTDRVAMSPSLTYRAYREPPNTATHPVTLSTVELGFVPSHLAIGPVFMVHY